MKKLENVDVESYFTTRPKLASYLLRQGFKGEITLNPYDVKRPAWLFPKSDQLLKSVNEYFGKEDKL